jgi:hypothetical protein
MSRHDSPLAGRMIFNVGSRRSGTLWLQRVVTAHPDVAAVPGETHLFSHGIAPLLERFQHAAIGSGEVGKLYVERDALLDAVRDLCDAAFAPLLGGRERLAERTPLHVLHVGLIAEVYPDAHFVHIVRDGRDVVRSVLAQRWGPDRAADAAREWRDAVLAARAGAPPERYVEVRYEEMHTAPESEIPRLYERLGLRVDDEVVAGALAEARVERNLDPAQTPAGAGKWRDALSAEDLAAFEEVAGDLREQLGYPAADIEAPRRRLRLRRRREPAPVVDAEVAAASALGEEELGQVIFGRLLEGLQSGSVDGVVDDGTRVRVEGEERRGPELLVGALRGDPAFGGRQVRGDVSTVAPLHVAVLDYELPDGEVARRTVVALIERGRVTELSLYSSTPAPQRMSTR